MSIEGLVSSLTNPVDAYRMVANHEATRIGLDFNRRTISSSEASDQLRALQAITGSFAPECRTRDVYDIIYGNFALAAKREPEVVKDKRVANKDGLFIIFFVVLGVFGMSFVSGISNCSFTAGLSRKGASDLYNLPDNGS